MKQEDTKAYAARVTQASKSELVVIMYEIILSHIKEAKEFHKKGDLEGFDKELKSSQKFLSELMGTLDCRYVIGLDLMALYLFVNKRIITAIIRRKPDTLDSAEKVLKDLLIGFDGVSKQDNTGPVMKNTQQIYAGLTYGRGTLNETFLDPNQMNRGFKA